jgi:hypothetical protein
MIEMIQYLASLISCLSLAIESCSVSTLKGIESKKEKPMYIGYNSLNSIQFAENNYLKILSSQKKGGSRGEPFDSSQLSTQSPMFLGTLKRLIFCLKGICPAKKEGYREGYHSNQYDFAYNRRCFLGTLKGLVF